VKLHLGCGHCAILGYVNIDCRPLGAVDVVCDASRLDKFDDGCAEVVYASHLLEHFWDRDVPDVLREWCRVLAPGGVLRLAVPDFEQIAKRYIGTADLLEVQGLVYSRPDYPEDAHRSAWDFTKLKSALDAAGLVDVSRYDWRATEHAVALDCASAHLPHRDFEHGQLMSLNVEARKPWEASSTCR